MAGLPVADSVVVVTGASSGIGRATAVAFATRGARVVAVGRRADRVQDTARACLQAGGAGHPVAVDVADPQAPTAVREQAERRFGPVDVLVNNAGVGLHKRVVDTDPAEVERMFAINFFAPVRLVAELLPGMLERRRGAVVNVTSVSGYLPAPDEAGYGAAKAALSRWTHGLAVELGGTGVQAAVVSPGAIDTEIWDHVGRFYRGRLYPPQVVAEAVARVVETGAVHRTAPRIFGLTPALYPLFGGPVRAGIRRYARRSATSSRP